MSRLQRVLAVIGALAISLFVSSASAIAVDPASQATAASAVAWLKTQQQPDGGFETVGFPGFETRDASLAIAEQAQTAASWSTTQSKAALAGLHFGGGSGKTPLNALDDYAATITTAGEAAKTIVLSAAPLGIDPAAFDAAGDGSPVNLTAKLDSGCGANTASFGTFSDTLYGVMAKQLVCGVAPANAVATIRAAQQADGGWNFSGDPTASGTDPDEIGLALMALAAGGVPGTDSAVQHALALLASSQQSSGAWIDFFGTEGNASSTALAMLGVAAAGYDPASACWRDTMAPSKAGTAYGNPAAWIRSQQQPDGHIASPYDTFGVNTLTTSQSVEGLLRSWLPITPAAAQTCTTPPPVVPTTPGADSGVTVEGVTIVVIQPTFAG
jgi:Prenyltransferase and squalene oxidase repeat